MRIIEEFREDSIRFTATISRHDEHVVDIIVSRDFDDQIKLNRFELGDLVAFLTDVLSAANKLSNIQMPVIR